MLDDIKGLCSRRHERRIFVHSGESHRERVFVVRDEVGFDHTASQSPAVLARPLNTLLTSLKPLPHANERPTSSQSFPRPPHSSSLGTITSARQTRPMTSKDTETPRRATPGQLQRLAGFSTCEVRLVALHLT